MNINALSNYYLQQDFPVKAIPVPAENPEQARQRPSDRSLAIKTDDSGAYLPGKQTPDSVDVRSSSGDESSLERRAEPEPKRLRYDMPGMRNWDHKLAAWFRTAITVQGTMPKSRGLHIDIVV